MKRIDGLTIKEKIAIIVNDGDGKYHKNKVEALVTLIQKEREEAVRGFVDSVVDCVLNNKAPHSVNIFNIALKAKLTAAKTNDIAEVDSFLGLLRGKAEAYLSQTKGGEDGR